MSTSINHITHRTVCCLHCKKEITIINLNRHYKSSNCLLNFKYPNRLSNLDHESLNCKFCNELYKNKNSLHNHEWRCKLNPHKIVHSNSLNNKRTNQYIKAKQLGLPKPQLSDETRKKLSISSSAQIWTEERKQRHSMIMLKTAKEKPESYSAGNQGRAKTYLIDGIKLKGSWEVKFYNWCKENNVIVQRPTEGFPYEYQNRTRTYYPDFFLPEFNKFVEVKGYETIRDKAKWSYFPHVLYIIRQKEITLINNKQFHLD